MRKKQKPKDLILQLVPIENLVEEIMDRTDVCVLGYLRTEDEEGSCVYINYSGDSDMIKVGLCDAIKHKIFSARDAYING